MVYKCTHWIYTHIMILHILFVYWRAIVLGAFIIMWWLNWRILMVYDVDDVSWWCWGQSPKSSGKYQLTVCSRRDLLCHVWYLMLFGGWNFGVEDGMERASFKNDIILLHPVNLVQSFGTFLVCLPTDYRRCASKLCFASWPLVCVVWSWIWIGFCCSD